MHYACSFPLDLLYRHMFIYEHGQIHFVKNENTLFSRLLKQKQIQRITKHFACLLCVGNIRERETYQLRGKYMFR